MERNHSPINEYSRVECWCQTEVHFFLDINVGSDYHVGALPADRKNLMLNQDQYTLWSVFRDRSIGEVIHKLLAYTRGYLLKAKLDADWPIRSVGRTIVIKRNGVIRIGRRSIVWPNVKLVAISQHPDKQAVISIGECTGIGDRTQIHCADSVTIGNDVGISWDVCILENDYHAPGGGAPRPKPVTIEDEAWIGARSTILKGVRVGKGAIVCAGSVVTANVPPYTFVAGNPARVIMKVESFKKPGHE